MKQLHIDDVAGKTIKGVLVNHSSDTYCLIFEGDECSLIEAVADDDCAEICGHWREDAFDFREYAMVDLEKLVSAEAIVAWKAQIKSDQEKREEREKEERRKEFERLKAEFAN